MKGVRQQPQAAMRYYDLITPEGTKDYLFTECAQRRSVEHRIEQIFKSRGFSEIITPVLEFFDVFSHKSAYFPQEQMYKFADSKGRLLVIRPYSTMPIARVVATRLKDAPLPLRLYYNQCVYANTPQLKGRSDQVAQTGIELIGSDSKLADLEVISTALEVLEACAYDTFSLELGDIAVFKELMNQLHTDEETQEQIRSLIEFKNYPALNDLLDTIGDSETVRAVKMLPRLFGGEEVFAKAAHYFKGERMQEILNNLRSVYEDAVRMCGNGKVTIDLGMVNRTDYYTGIIIKGYLSGYGDEVLSGGRYDKLIAEFGYDVPATGFAVHVDAISQVYAKHDPQVSAHSDVLIFAGEGCEVQAISRAKKLRAEGLIVELAMQDSVEDAREYARQRGIAKLVIINDETATEIISG